MELHIRGRGLAPTPVLRRNIERRLRRSLGRLGPRLERVTVRLVRDHGRSRHTSRKCQVTVDAHGLPTLRITASSRTLRAAFARAASRTTREVAHELKRGLPGR